MSNDRPVTASLVVLSAVISLFCFAARAEEALAIRPPMLAEDQVAIDLGGKFEDVCVGGNGRFLIFYLKEQQKLALFDVSAVRLFGEVSVPGEDVLFAAGAKTLVIAFPKTKALQAWDLATLKQTKGIVFEKRTVECLGLGPASRGPLLIGLSGYTDGGSTYIGIAKLFEPESLTSIEFEGPQQLRVELDQRARVRASADGLLFACWRVGTSPMGFQTLLFKKNRLEMNYEHTSKGVLLPSENGKQIYTGEGIYGQDAKPIDARQFDLSRKSFALPAVHGPFHLRVQISDDKSATEASVGIHRNGQPSPIVTLDDVNLRPPGLSDRFGRKRPSYDQRIYYVPQAKVLLTLPEANDKVVVRRVDLAEELAKSGKDYLVVLSEPPQKLEVGKMLKYQIDAKSNGAGQTYKLDSAPDGMTVSNAGEITWQPKSRPLGGKVNISCIVSNTAGKSVDHDFEMSVVRPTNDVRGGFAQFDPQTVEVPDGPFDVVRSDALRSLLIVQGNQVAVLADDGVSLKSVQKLKKTYAFVQPRKSYLVAVSHVPPSVDIINSRTLAVTKSMKLEYRATDLALHPRVPISYIAGRESFNVPGCKFIVFNETTGQGKKSDEFVGTRLAVDPRGRYLMTAYSDIYQRGAQLLMNPDRFHVVPSYGSFGWLLGYRLARDGTPKLAQLHPQAGGHQLGMRVASDGSRVTNVTAEGLKGWNPLDLEDSPVTYQERANQNAYDLDYHPTLPLTACIIDEKPALLDRESGEVLKDRLEFSLPTPVQLHRLHFSPNGRQLVMDFSVNDVHYLRAASIKLTPEELRETKTSTGTTPSPTAPAAKIPLAQLDALKGGLGKEMTPRDIGHWFTDSVVVVKGGDTTGSGFVVGTQGYILSCAHCIPVDNRVTITYRVSSGDTVSTKSVDATVIRVDEKQDLALLKIDSATPLRPARLAAIADPEIGERVCVISNPGLGDKILDATMTEGIVSNPRRELDGVQFIQTNATINPGSSGGPVFNSRGLIIGLVAVKGRIESTGFAVPSSALTKFLLSASTTTGQGSNLRRHWYDTSLTHQIEADYGGIRDGKAILKKTDGSQVSIPLEKLSRQDQEFIRILMSNE
jgi:S1-C subfamily serine protease